MIKIYALGGSGEIGRNSFAIEWEDGAILLDCGVKREIRPGCVGEYPLITKELTAKLKAVFLSHVHEDHSAALPLVYALGYRGKVYTSSESMHTAAVFIQKWMDFAKQNHGVLPFDKAAAEKIKWEPLALGKNEIEGIAVYAGRSGHVLGGLWFQFLIDGERIFYSGDIAFAPMLLKRDTPTPCNIAILNCAYAGKSIKQVQQCRQLLLEIQATLAENGKVILPLPPKGRASELYFYLRERITTAPVYVDSEIADNAALLLGKREWIQPFEENAARPNVVIVKTDEERRAVCQSEGACVILTQDGMLTAAPGQVYYEALHKSAVHKVIITGHVAAGTPGANLFDETHCREHGIKIKKAKILFKVHFDDEDVLAFNEILQAKRMLLFHSPKAATAPLREQLARRNVEAECLEPGECFMNKRNRSDCGQRKKISIVYEKNLNPFSF